MAVRGARENPRGRSLPDVAAEVAADVAAGTTDEEPGVDGTSTDAERGESGDPSTEIELWNRVKLRLILAGVDPVEVRQLDSQRDALQRSGQLDRWAPTPFGASEERQSNEAVSLMRSHILWSDNPRITIEDLAHKTGLDVATTRRARMLLGLPDPGDDAVCRVEEVEAFQGLAAGIELYGTQTILQYTRVIGSALATIAEAALTVFARRLADMTDANEAIPEGDEYTLMAFDALEAFGSVPEVLRVAGKLHFEQTIEQLGGEPSLAHMAAVGFVDLTGSTITTEELGDEAMASALERFEEWSAELAISGGGRVVKYIGDEVMFVMPDLPSAAVVASELLARISEDPALRNGRAGIAYGEVLSRDGDWFGTTVNKAARLVDRARRGTVLMTGEGVESVDGAVDKGRRRLKGIADRVEIWRKDVAG